MKDDTLALRDAHGGLLRKILAAASFRGTYAAMTGPAVLSPLSWMVPWFKPGGRKSAEDAG